MVLKPAQGVAGELQARARVTECEGSKAALVAAALLWSTGEIDGAVRAAVEGLTGIPGANVILHESHTHASAPLAVPAGGLLPHARRRSVRRTHEEARPGVGGGLLALCLRARR